MKALGTSDTISNIESASLLKETAGGFIPKCFPTRRFFFNRTTDGRRGHGGVITEATPARPLTKTCTKCGQIKPLTEFSNDPRSPDKHRSSCKACKVAAEKLRRATVSGHEPAPTETVIARNLSKSQKVEAVLHARTMVALRSLAATDAISEGLAKIIYHEFEGDDEAELTQVLHIAGMRFKCTGTGYTALLVARQSIAEVCQRAVVKLVAAEHDARLAREAINVSRAHHNKRKEH